MLIGICGKAGAGKDTVGDFLVENYSFEKISLADPLERLVKDVFVLDDKTVYDREEREKPLEQWNGWSVRKLLQFVGTELFRNNIDDAIWVKSLCMRINDNPEKNYVVTDIRFPNEMDFLKKHASCNFYSFKIIRPNFDGNVGLAGHASESYDLSADYVIKNDGDIESLYNHVKDIFKEIQIKQGDINESL